MSEKAKMHLILPEPSEDLITSEPWTIETYADGLMNELFSEIDDILEGGDTLPYQTVQQSNRYSGGNTRSALPQEYIHHLQTITIPPIVSPNTQPQTVQPAGKVRKNPLSTIVIDNPAVRRPTGKPSLQKLQRSMGIVLWVGTTIGLAIAGIIWMLNSGFLNRLVSKSFQQSLLQPQVQSKVLTEAQVQADLVNYILGALAVIDRQEAKSSLRSQKAVALTAVPSHQTALAYITPQTVGNLPTPVAANNITPAPGRSTTIVERIYIPVYQAPQPMRYKLPSVPGTPRPLNSVATLPNKLLESATKPAPVKLALDKVQKASKPITVNALAAVRHDIKPVAVHNKPVVLRQAPKPVPVLSAVSVTNVAPPQLPTATAQAPASTPNEQQQVLAVVSAPKVATPSHTLEGLLELGQKSAALFKIEGITRRVEIGEAIGSSGWTLVDVANGEAIIRRNGEVRSIYAGQTF